MADRVLKKDDLDPRTLRFVLRHLNAHIANMWRDSSESREDAIAAGHDPEDEPALYCSGMSAAAADLEALRNVFADLEERHRKAQKQRIKR